jgi:hypothetical protein
MQCAICGRVIQPLERQLTTTTNEPVHLWCSEVEATRTWEQRCWLALLDALLIVLGTVIIWRDIGAPVLAVILASLATVLHVRFHARWWYYIRRDMQRWITRRSRPQE